MTTTIEARLAEVQERRRDFTMAYADLMDAIKRLEDATEVQPIDPCPCETCIEARYTDGPVNRHMVLCPTCGNKRCPHATNHELECTNSNAVGQKGSSWENVKLVGEVFDDLSDNVTRILKGEVSK